MHKVMPIYFRACTCFLCIAHKSHISWMAPYMIGRLNSFCCQAVSSARFPDCPAAEQTNATSLNVCILEKRLWVKREALTSDVIGSDQPKYMAVLGPQGQGRHWVGKRGGTGESTDRECWFRKILFYMFVVCFKKIRGYCFLPIYHLESTFRSAPTSALSPSFCFLSSRIKFFLFS